MSQASEFRNIQSKAKSVLSSGPMLRSSGAAPGAKPPRPLKRRFLEENYILGAASADDDDNHEDDSSTSALPAPAPSPPLSTNEPPPPAPSQPPLSLILPCAAPDSLSSTPQPAPAPVSASFWQIGDPLPSLLSLQEGRTNYALMIQLHALAGIATSCINETRSDFLALLRSTVHHSLSLSYTMRPLQHEFTVSQWLWTNLFSAWASFLPETALPHTSLYRRPASQEQVIALFGSAISKEIPPIPGQQCTHLQVVWDSVYIAYRLQDKNLWLTFSYLPDPLPEGFLPNRVRRGRSSGVTVLKLTWTPAQ